ncbi:MAG: non-hydrolyzing UDP-N-acetylglucosamine 2-epimerase [Candidatus Puniceispirillaceae bacterium]
MSNSSQNSAKLRVMTILGTRPEIIRLSRVMVKMDAYFDHKIVHTGQNYDYELNEIFFDDLELRAPDIYLGCTGDSPGQMIADVIAKTDTLLAQHKPDAILILGDTNSAMAAIAAKRHQIPIFHMEAGNRCFDLRVPEEINRKIVDHIADINMPYSQIARDYLIAEGIKPDLIVKTGSPMDEVLAHYMPKIKTSTILSDLDLQEDRYFAVSAHRQENVDSPQKLALFVEALNKLCDHYDLPVIVSTHPRTRQRIAEHNITFHDLVRLQKPLCFTDYITLQTHAKLVLSDSGTITEEASILNFRAVNIRDAHERPEGMEEGAVMLTGMNSERIMNALTILEAQPKGEDRLLDKVADYHAPHLSEKVVRTILSYTDYVNRVIWKKHS